MKLTRTLLALTLLGGALGANAAMITPTSASHGADVVAHPSSIYSINQTINSVGLSGVADESNYASISHSTDIATGFHPNNTGSHPGNNLVPDTHYFHLGGAFDLDGFYLWNSRTTGGRINTFTLRFENDGDALFDDASFDFTNDMDTSFGQLFSFATVTDVTDVMLYVTSAPGGADATFGEVRLNTAEATVPAPLPLALMLAGYFAMGRLRRLR